MLPVLFGSILRLTAALAVLGSLVFGGYELISNLRPRTLGLCIVSDVPFRLEKPNWEYQADLWLAEVNRAFAPAGIAWEKKLGGEAYPEGTAGELRERRRLMEDNANCRASDVILGLTSSSDERSMSAGSASAFGRTALVVITGKDSDALAAGKVTRVLTTLFGGQTGTETIVSTDAPEGEGLDTPTVNLVRTLRFYDFRRGVAALPGKWERRAHTAIAEAIAGRVPQPRAEAHRMLARAYSAALRHAEAVDQLKAAAKESPNDSNLRLELGVELLANSDPEAAVAAFKEAARLQPESAIPHAALGALYFNANRSQPAIDELRIAAQLDPRNPEYLTALGRALASQMGRVDEALEAFEAALKLSPTSGSAAVGLQSSTLEKKVMSGAVRELEARLRQDPHSAAAHLHLGLAHAGAGEFDAARKDFENSARLDPRNGSAILALSRLHFLRGDYGQAKKQLDAAIAAGAKPSLTFVNEVTRKAAER